MGGKSSTQKERDGWLVAFSSWLPLQTFHYKLVYEDKVKEVADGISKLDAAVIMIIILSS